MVEIHNEGWVASLAVHTYTTKVLYEFLLGPVTPSLYPVCTVLVCTAFTPGIGLTSLKVEVI
jgi:hypothetical protein